MNRNLRTSGQLLILDSTRKIEVRVLVGVVARPLIRLAVRMFLGKEPAMAFHTAPSTTKLTVRLEHYFSSANAPIIVLGRFNVLLSMGTRAIRSGA